VQYSFIDVCEEKVGEKDTRDRHVQNLRNSKRDIKCKERKWSWSRGTGFLERLDGMVAASR
jgi:hypothetical protein